MLAFYEMYEGLSGYSGRAREEEESLPRNLLVGLWTCSNNSYYQKEKYPDKTLYRTGSGSANHDWEQAKKKNIPNPAFVVGDCELSI